MIKFFSLVFRPCRHMAELISETADRPASRAERWALGVHTAYCTACRRYRQQIRRIRELIAAAGSVIGEEGKAQLRPEAKERIVRSLETQ